MDNSSHKKESKKKQIGGRDMIDLVLGWSVEEVKNKHLYKGQVSEIPDTFMSTVQYMKAFVPPLLEEMHAELFSSAQELSRAPTCKIWNVKMSKDYKLPKDLFYKISLRRSREPENGESGAYEPMVGDLIALADVRPKCIDDLNNSKHSYLIAYIYETRGKDSDALSILSSRPIEYEGLKKSKGKSNRCEEDESKNKKEMLFAVYLTNMMTNIRIWKALNSEPEGKNMNIIERVLQKNRNDDENCIMCSLKEKNDLASSFMKDMAHTFGLNDSQEAAVLSCIGAGECCHQNTVKLVWGPPGTGKTKMVASLLYALCRMNCRTLTCAPTNVAVLEVAARVRRSITEQLKHETYGIGDIVLFGNQERMKIDDQNELLDVFLDYRVDVLEECLAGWNHALTSMTCLLEDPKEQYHLYLQEKFTEMEEKEDKNEEKKQIKSNQEKEQKNHFVHNKDKKKQKVGKKVGQTLEDNTNNKKRTGKQSKGKEVEGQAGLAESNRNKKSTPLTLDEYVKKRFKSNVERLKFCIENLYTHLPTIFMPLQMAKNMIRACSLLRSLETLLLSDNVPHVGSKQVLQGFKDLRSIVADNTKLSDTKKECLDVLRLLPTEFPLPNFTNPNEIRKFCLAYSCLLFCTASSSTKLYAEEMAPLHMLVIDEAAQLKECESTIPMQVSGLRHAILVGDEQQLPAMVNSKISEKAHFGRSLFERLVKLGWKRHILNVQYRMHPSISLLPNRQFYKMRIANAPNVKGSAYRRCLLNGNMYRSYSFININQGKEEFGESRSLKNVVEAAVIANIVKRLFEEFKRTKKSLSIGVISPYKAQVLAVQEMVGEYSSDSDIDFCKC